MPPAEHSPAVAAASSHCDAPALISDAQKGGAAYLPPHVDGTIVECAKIENEMINLGIFQNCTLSRLTSKISAGPLVKYRYICIIDVTGMTSTMPI